MSAASAGGESHRTVHQPVLVRAVLRLLALEPGLVVVDGTVGAGGHSRHILEQIGLQGRLIGLDRDPAMIRRAAERLDAPNCSLIADNYSRLREILDELHVDRVDRILLDLGLSSDQLADERRGFGFESDATLDLRFDPSQGRPAAEIVNTADEAELERLFGEYGEERHSRRIVAEIARHRQQGPIRTGRQLAGIIRQAVPKSARAAARGLAAPAVTARLCARVFQALRIAVNDELEHLERTLNHVLEQTLKPGGRAVVITFHSLEDRLVKNAFRKRQLWENLTPKPVTATAAEKKVNPRSRTAKIRAAVRKAPE